MNQEKFNELQALLYKLWEERKDLIESFGYYRDNDTEYFKIFPSKT